MDFGSVTKARIPIRTRQDGLLQQVKINDEKLLFILIPPYRISLLRIQPYPIELQSYLMYKQELH
jgi:hypothetical protein